MQEIKDKLIVALDVDSLDKAKKLVNILFPVVKTFKVGSQLFTACGPEIIRIINEKGAKVFLDLKFCDIPNTIAKAVESARDLGVYMLTVHTFGANREMLRAAVKAAEGPGGPLILGVTLLTSLDRKDLEEFGIRRLLPNEVIALAKLAKDEGLNGIVCSPREIKYIRRRKDVFGEGFIIVTPGVRPKRSSLDEHRRVMTPAEAIKWGADYIVVGRPIIESEDPRKVAEKILDDIEGVVKLKQVVFSIVAPNAKKVYVVGDFNNWKLSDNNRMKHDRGRWVAKLNLKPGQYHYSFFIDGKWTGDPSSPSKKTALHKRESSLIEVINK